MENNHEIKLIEGKLSPLEASKVLFSLINSKINYHNLEMFSAQIRADGNVDNSKKRLEYLNKAADDLDAIIKNAVANGKTFEISSVISINVIDK